MGTNETLGPVLLLEFLTSTHSDGNFYHIVKGYHPMGIWNSLIMLEFQNSTHVKYPFGMQNSLNSMKYRI